MENAYKVFRLPTNTYTNIHAHTHMHTHTNIHTWKREERKRGCLLSDIKDQNFEMILKVEVHGVRNSNARGINTVRQENLVCFKLTIGILVYCRLKEVW